MFRFLTCLKRPIDEVQQRDPTRQKTDRDRQKTDRRQTKTDRDRPRQTETDRDRQTETQGQRQTARDRLTEADRQRQTDRGDLEKGLQNILDEVKKGSTKIDAIVIETTGMADPVPIIRTFMANPALTAELRLDGLVAVADAKHLPARLDDKACPMQMHAKTRHQRTEKRACGKGANQKETSAKIIVEKSRTAKQRNL